MPYTAPTPSTVAPGDTFPATAYNIIAADLADHESRIKTGVESYTTAQKTALTGVATGTVIYDSTLGLMQVWNGSAWYAASGFIPINTTVVNSQTSVNVDNVFPTTFSAHRVVITDWNLAAGSSSTFSFRTAGASPATDSTANYNWLYRTGIYSTGAASFNNGVSQTSHSLFIGGGSLAINHILEITNAAQASPTSYTMAGTAFTPSANSVQGSGYHAASTIFGGFNISTSASFSCTIRVYGFV